MAHVFMARYFALCSGKAIPPAKSDERRFMTLKQHTHTDRSRTSSSLLYGLRGEKDTAWIQFVDRYSQGIYRRCRRCGLSVQDAEDLVQDVFMAVARSFERYQPLTQNASFRKWLGTITTNKLRDYWRNQQKIISAPGGTTWHRTVQSMVDQLSESHRGIFAACGNMGDSWQGIIHAIRAEVSARDWQIFASTVLENKVPAEVAKTFKVTANVVYLVRSRLLRRIRELAATASD